MLVFNTLELTQVLIAQVQVCSPPNPLQMAAIVTLLEGVLLFGGAGVVALTALATTMVNQILAGASIAAIAAAIEVDIQTTGVSVGLLSGIVLQIRSILGC